MHFLEKIETYYDNKSIKLSYLYFSLLILFIHFCEKNFSLNVTQVYISIIIIFFIFRKNITKPKFGAIKFSAYFLILVYINLRGINSKILNYLIFFFFTIVLIEPFFRNKLYYPRLFIIILILLEAVFTKIKSSNDIKNKDNEISYPDKILPTKEIKNIGYIFKPNTKTTIYNINLKHDTISSINYCSNQIGSRIECQVDTNIFQDKFICFLGCSFTFGLGLDYKHTFGEILEKKIEGFNTYNFGCFGYGPHQIALQLNSPYAIINNKILKEKEGCFIYTYIDDHLNRVYGGSDYLKYGNITSDVFVDKNKLILKKRDLFKYYFSDLIRESKFLNYFNVKLNYPKSTKFYKRFADIINYCYESSSLIKNKSKFIVGIYPNNGNDLNWIKYLNKNIKVIIVQKPKDFTEKKYLLKNDCHPNSLLNEYYINKIIKDIR